MFEVKHLYGKTYYFEAYTNVGIYRQESNKVTLIDSTDHKRITKALNNCLNAEKLTVDTIVCTHCHVDHICGNRFFREKDNCKIIATRKELPFVLEPDLEGSFYFTGIDTDKSRNPFFLVEPSSAEEITKENTPDGLEFISLPGHSFDMIGVRTDDDVVFLADSVLSEKTWTEYKMPFFHDINKSIETLEKIEKMKARIFVPSHNEPIEDISELARLNKRCLKELKNTVFDLCDGTGFDEMFKKIIKEFQINVRTEKYVSYSVMLRNVLQALVEDNKIKGILEDGSFIYLKKEL